MFSTVSENYEQSSYCSTSRVTLAYNGFTSAFLKPECELEVYENGLDVRLRVVDMY